MFNSAEEKIKHTTNKIMLMSVLDTPGMLMLALWAYTKFGGDAEPFHPLLNNFAILNGLLYTGLGIVSLCAIQIVRLFIKKAELQKELQ